MDYLILKQVIHNLERYCANYRAISGPQNEIGLCPLFITKKLIAYLAYVRNCVHKQLFFFKKKSLFPLEEYRIAGGKNVAFTFYTRLFE